MDREKYYTDILTAFIKGKAEIKGDSDFLKTAPSNDELLQYALDKGFKINHFKRTEDLPRVNKVLGILRGLYPETLLDVGSGKGVFLWPLMNEFPHLTITAIEKKALAVEDINALNLGGIENIRALLMDASDTCFDDNSFDAVTALEVIEHIEEYEKVLDELLRITKRFLIISVPSREDNNPDHWNLITETILREHFNKRDCSKVSFQYVQNHMIAVVIKRSEV